MTYDKKTGQIKVDGDMQDMIADTAAFFTDVTSKLANDPQASEGIKKLHNTSENLRKTALEAVKRREDRKKIEDAINSAKQSENTFISKLNKLSKPVKTIISINVFWTFFVIFRTVERYEFLGITLYQWEDEWFLLNWILPIAISWGIWWSIVWITKK